MREDLIERLREYAQADDLHKDERDTLIAAAAALEAMQAELERLRERDIRWQKIANAARMADMRSERMAEAIRAYKDECDNPAKDYVLRAKRRDEMFALLRQAA